MSRDKLRLKGIRENSIFIGPKSVNIHITNLCNLNCSYCWFHSKKVKFIKEKTLPFSAFKKIIDDLQGLGAESITLSGEGEPTLHPKIRGMIMYVKVKGLRLNILTNGTFGRGLLKDIMKADSLTINIATLLPENYRKIQSISGNDIMEKVIKNIITISRIRKRLGLRKPKIRIGFIINEENYFEVEDVFSFAQEHSLEIRFRLMKANKLNEHLIISKKSLNKLRQSLRSIMKKDKGITNAGFIYSKLMEPDFLKKTLVFYPIHNYRRVFYFSNFKDEKIRCYMGWYFSHIDLNGNIRFCCQNPFLVFGNIKKSPFRKIWSSEKYMEMRMKCKSGIDTKQYNWMECRQCPFAEDNIDIENLLGNDSYEGE